jgi:hypothetical protein
MSFLKPWALLRVGNRRYFNLQRRTSASAATATLNVASREWESTEQKETPSAFCRAARRLRKYYAELYQQLASGEARAAMCRLWQA